MTSSSHTPPLRALLARRQAELSLWGAVAVCLLALLLAFGTIRAGRATEQILVLDPQGNLLAGPVEPLASSRGFFHTTALCATHAALQRSPAGFDLYELLRLYFGPRALQTLEDDLQGRIEDIRRRNLQQKPLVESIAAPVVAGEARLVEVRGRLVSAGAFGGHAFYHEPAFVLLLTFRRNPNLGQAGAYPWICDEVDLRLRDADA